MTVSAGAAAYSSNGIWVYTDGYTFTIDSGATVKVSSGTAGFASIGAHAWDSILVKGTLEATAASGSESYGVEAYKGTFTVDPDGSVTATGQTRAFEDPYTVPDGQTVIESAKADGSDATAVAVGSSTSAASKYVKIWSGTHRHSFLYITDGATIYAMCTEDGCTLTGREVTLTIHAPTLTAPGISAGATLTGLEVFNAATGLHVAETDIKYFTAEEAEADGQKYTRPGYALDQAPTDLGDYFAVLTLSNRKTSETETEDVRALVSYTIAPPPAFGDAALVLPAAAKTVEESAFAGDAELTSVDAGSCTSIGMQAFKDCTGLTQIRLPKDCAIGENAFDGCPLVYVYAPAGGSTEAYCRDYANLVFVEE